MREWSMRLYLLDEDGAERSADVFTKVVYNLHPTFENPVQSWSLSVLPIDCASTHAPARANERIIADLFA